MTDKPNRPHIFAAPKPKAAPTTLASLTNPGFDMALRAIGFDAARNGTPIAVTTIAPSAPQKHAADLGLRRRDWILDAMERQRALSPIAGGIPRMRDLPGQDFLDHFYAPGRPVLIEGAIEAWPALARWTPKYLREIVGPAPVEYQGGRSQSADYELHKDNHKAVMPFDRFIDRIGEPGNDAYITAYNSGTNASAFAPLMADVLPIAAYLTPAHGMLWIGPGGTFTPIHFDLTNNLLVQVTGEKQVILMPPSETRWLANSRHVFSDVHDIESPAYLARFPEARRARRFIVDLAPGDMLYIPVGWWHQVRAKSFSAMLTYTNFLWPNNAYTAFPGD